MEYLIIQQLVGAFVLLLGLLGMFVAGYGYGYEKAQKENSTVDQ